MMHPDAHAAVYVCVSPVDMRKQAATLAPIVEQTLRRNIFEPALYVFSNARRDRIKIVYWQRNGLRLWSKRLEGQDRFIVVLPAEGLFGAARRCRTRISFCREFELRPKFYGNRFAVYGHRAGSAG
jgi:transposase